MGDLPLRTLRGESHLDEPPLADPPPNRENPAIAGTAALLAALEVEVATSAGTPAGGAVVVIFRDGVVLESAVADAAGIARLAARGSDNGGVVSEVNLRTGDGMCMGYHGWLEGDFGKHPVAVPKPGDV